MKDLCTAFRDWLRAAPRSRTSHVAAPVGDEAQIVVSRIDGSAGRSDVPTDVALLQFDVWGALDPISYEETAEMKNDLRVWLDELGRQDVGGRTVLGAEVRGDRWLPDPSTNRPRFALTVSVPAVTGT